MWTNMGHMKYLLLVAFLVGCGGEAVPGDDQPPPADGAWVVQTWQFTNTCHASAAVGLKTANADVAGSVVPPGQTFSWEINCTAGNRICGTSKLDGQVETAQLSCFACAPGTLPAIALPCR
jgi:hypothetical protein